MAMISWDETVGALVTIVAAITGGVVAKDKYMQRRTSKAQASKDEQDLAVVFQHECDRRHADFEKLINVKFEGFEGRLDDVRADIRDGFLRIEATINRKV